MLKTITEDQLNGIWNALEDYQKQGVLHVLKKPRAIFDLPVGAGKSLMGLCVALKMATNRILIVGTKSSLSTWRKEIPKWINTFAEGQDFLIVEGTPIKREQYWKTPVSIHVCTFQTLAQDLKKGIITLDYDVLLGDEIHKARNRKKQNYNNLKISLKKIKYFIGLTGTLMSRGVQDVWAILNLCNPKHFSSYWRLINNYCQFDEPDMWGRREYLGAKNPVEYAKEVGPYIYRMTDEELGDKLPPIRFIPMDLIMPAEARKIYDKLDEEMYYIFDNTETLIFSTIMTETLKLRQFCVCPKAIHPDLPIGAAVTGVVDKWDAEEDESISHCVLYTPFTSSMDIIQDYLKKEVGRDDVYQLRGGMNSHDVNEAIKKYRDSKGVMLCSIKFAQSFELDSSPTGFFLGLEFDPNDNTQAAGRQRRKTSKRAANMFYSRQENSTDLLVEAIAINKETNVRNLTKYLKSFRSP